MRTDISDYCIRAVTRFTNLLYAAQHSLLPLLVLPLQAALVFVLVLGTLGARHDLMYPLDIVIQHWSKIE